MATKKKKKKSLKRLPGFTPGPSPVFLGLEPEYTDFKESKVAVLPLPYEATTSYGAGTRFGPEAIISASAQVELYDPKVGSEPALEIGVHTLPPLFPNLAGPERMISAIDACATPLYRKGKFVLGLGGEHTITVGLVRAAARKWSDLVIVQVDAHADLRNDYEGTRYSHACAMRRALEELNGAQRGVRLIQVGIRNISTVGHRFLKAQTGRIQTFWADKIVAETGNYWLVDTVELVRGKNVYLTIDLDGLDPSIMPAVGTPEPGGLLWHQVTALVEALGAEANLVAADIVELAPQPGNRAPDFLAAKLGYLIACRAAGE